MRSTDQSKNDRVLRGKLAAPGIAHGTVHVVQHDDLEPPAFEIAPGDVDKEIERFEQALLMTRAEIRETQQLISESIGASDASIFDAHMLVVEDQTLIDEVVRLIREELRNAENVFARVARRYVETLASIDDPYLRERSVDIQDVARRVIRNLLGREKTAFPTDGKYILAAEDFSPSETASLSRDHVLGFVTEAGSRTSHSAIMARSLGIPAVVGLRGLLDEVQTGDVLVLDGFHGEVVLSPSEETLCKYREIESKHADEQRKLDMLRDADCVTKDGVRIVLSANIEIEDEVADVISHGAEGVGLYRTEYFFLNFPGLPDEDQQAENYTRIARALHPKPLIIRTLDVGGDKVLEQHGYEAEANPFLGWRAIRFCLEETALFKTQLRAILRASVVGNVKLMYPLISSLEELQRANQLLEECREELRACGVPFAEEFEVGAMIEVPAAALTADILAKHADFFSIGTNDLIQYATAVDRVNEKVANLYSPTHPAILRLMKMIVDAGHAEGIWTGVCGEMAGEIALTPLLVGLGVDELSTGSATVPSVKKAVRSLDAGACRELVDAALKMESAAEILEASLEIARSNYPELL